MREFKTASLLKNGNLALALAPALTPKGVEDAPRFFQGTAVKPQILARGLLVLADITAARYFKYTPAAMRDPVLSAQGDRLRAECFSACNSVYARLDLLQPSFDGEISFGTTNVDIGPELRTALTEIKQKDKLKLSVGSDGLSALALNYSEEIAPMGRIIVQRPVEMPERWVRALGNTAAIHKEMKPMFAVKGTAAKAFIASLPAATGQERSGWLTYSPAGVKILPRRSAGAVWVSGLHRLSALKRVMTDTLGLCFYTQAEEKQGGMMIEADLGCARLTLSLTAESWQGYSGEGALLEGLARPEVIENAWEIGSVLSFEAKLNEKLLAEKWRLSGGQAEAALALLAVSGKLGYDLYENSYFHRELPEEPERVHKDNPRLVAARKLIDQIESIGGGQWIVHSQDMDYRVTYDPNRDIKEAKCTCAWYFNHQNGRGPCKHILAVRLKEGSYEQQD